MNVGELHDRLGEIDRTLDVELIDGEDERSISRWKEVSLERLIYQMNMITETRNDFEILDLLCSMQEFCHAPGCDEVEQCPRNHAACDPRLNLETSIVWTAVRWARTALDDGVSIVKAMDRIATLIDVLILHRWQCEQSFEMVRRLYELLKTRKYEECGPQWRRY